MSERGNWLPLLLMILGGLYLGYAVAWAAIFVVGALLSALFGGA